MKRPLTYILLLTIIWSCNQPAEKTERIEPLKPSKSESTPIESSNASIFQYQEFEISNGKLGEIKIGMTISEAEQKFEGLKKEDGHATNFGYGGGSPAYLYYDQNKLVFGLIPTLNTDTVLLIIAISPELTTNNGLNSESTVKNISEKYQGIQVNQDLMNGWEYISDTTNNWDFVFKTNEKTVGEYPELEVPSDLRNIEIKTDWITIK